MVRDSVCGTPGCGNERCRDFNLGLGPGLLAAIQPRRPADGIWCSARLSGVLMLGGPSPRPDKLSFAPRGQSSTSNSCRWVAILLAMMLSLAGGVVVWMVWKAKGLIVAGLVAEVLKALEEREAQANQHEPAASEPQVECGGSPQTEETRGLAQDFSTVERGDKRALASTEPWGPDELVSFASSMAWQVAQKLSKQENLAQGVIDRFAEDLGDDPHRG